MSGIGRNDPCPCGSGMKYKKCCLDKDEQAQRRERIEAAERPVGVETFERPGRAENRAGPSNEGWPPEPGPEEDEPDWEPDGDVERESEPELGDILERSPDEVLELLSEMGVQESAEAFGTFCSQEGSRSIRPRVERWALEAGIDMAAEDGRALRCAAVALWRELSPGLACVEDLDDLVYQEEKKLDTRSKADHSLTAEAWLRAWNVVLELLPQSIRSLQEADALFVAGGPLAVFLDELDGLLWGRARNQDRTEWLGKGLGFANSILERFPDDRDIAVRWGIRQAQQLFAMGRVEEGEERFSALKERFPDEAEVVTGWSHVYSLFQPRDWFPDDPAKALEVCRAGLATLPEDGRRGVRLCIREIERGIPRDRSLPRDYLADSMTRSLVDSGKHVAPDVWRGLVARGAQVVPMLNEIMEDVATLISEEGLPGLDAKKAAWGPTHAAFIAASSGDPSSVPSLLKAAAVDDGNEMLAEGMDGFPVRFGKEAVPQFLDFCLDESVGTYPRGLCVKGVVRAGSIWPELQEGIAVRLAEAIESGEYDAEMVTWIARAAVRTGHPRVRDAVLQAGERDVIDPGIAGDAEELVEEPADWYARERSMPSSAEEHFRESRLGPSRYRGSPFDDPTGGKARKKKAKRFGKNKKKRR